MLRENLRDAGEIVEHILSQPITASGLEKPLSLLEASKQLLDNPSSPELKKIVETLLHNPDAFHLMVEELKLLSNDL